LDAPDGTSAQVEAYLVPFGERVLILAHDKCIVYAKRIIGSEIVLVAHDGSPR
jgi:hypothetical protein